MPLQPPLDKLGTLIAGLYPSPGRNPYIHYVVFRTSGYHFQVSNVRYRTNHRCVVLYVPLSISVCAFT